MKHFNATFILGLVLCFPLMGQASSSTTSSESYGISTGQYIGGGLVGFGTGHLIQGQSGGLKHTLMQVGGASLLALGALGCVADETLDALDPQRKRDGRCNHGTLIGQGASLFLVSRLWEVYEVWFDAPLIRGAQARVMLIPVIPTNTGQAAQVAGLLALMTRYGCEAQRRYRT